MAATKKRTGARAPLARNSSPKKKRGALTHGSALKQLVTTARDVAELATFTRKNISKFLTQIKKTVQTRRGA